MRHTPAILRWADGGPPEKWGAGLETEWGRGAATSYLTSHAPNSSPQPFRPRIARPCRSRHLPPHHRSLSVDDQLEPLAGFIASMGGDPSAVLQAYPGLVAVPVATLEGTRHVLRQLGTPGGREGAAGRGSPALLRTRLRGLAGPRSAAGGAARSVGGHSDSATLRSQLPAPAALILSAFLLKLPRPHHPCTCADSDIAMLLLSLPDVYEQLALVLQRLFSGWQGLLNLQARMAALLFEQAFSDGLHRCPAFSWQLSTPSRRLPRLRSSPAL